jgi:hypothetical protein
MLENSVPSTPKPGIPLFSSVGKEVAEVNNGCLQKHVRLSRHLYRKFDAWSFDKEMIDKAIGLGAKAIDVYEDEQHRTYHVSMDVFMRKSKLAPPCPGYANQLYLSRSDWEVDIIPWRSKKAKTND